MTTYVDHVVEQIQHNLGFLVTQGHMSRADADSIIARLPSSDAQTTPIHNVAPSMPRSVPVPPAPVSAGTVRAKATWAYNENGQVSNPHVLKHECCAHCELKDPDDLSFKTGDIVEIVEETNADWWTGRINGKEGLFPSNHVEILPAGAAPPTAPRRVLAPPPSYSTPAVALQSTPQVTAPQGKTPYRAFGAAHHGADKPPPSGAGAVNSVGLQEADGQDKKKSKYGKYGNTVSRIL